MGNRRSAFRVLALVLAVGAIATAGVATATIESQIQGSWQGELPGGKAGEKMRILLKVGLERGELVARVQSPDQDDREYIAQTIRLTDRRVEFFLMFISASYDGTMSEDGNEIRGTWKQRGVEAPLVFRRATGASYQGRVTQ